MRNKPPINRRAPPVEELDLEQTGYADAIVLQEFSGNVKFDITSTMMHLLNMKRLYGGLDHEDPNQHLKNFTEICSVYRLPGVSQEAMRLRLFPFSLTREATVWLRELPNESITCWGELTAAFLERFFHPSPMILLRDEINNFRQLPNEALHEAWLRFNKKIKQCPNHRLPDDVLLQSFYRSLDSLNKVVANNIVEGSLMDQLFVVASAMLDKMTRTNRA